MNLDPFTNTKLKKIVNVYQLEFINGKSPGIGDFLRGCFSFMQIAELLKLEFDFDISNHPISKYIENTTNVKGLDYKNIEIYYEYNRSKTDKHNYEDTPININTNFLNTTINWLNSKDCEIFGFFSNAFPSFNKHTPEGINKLNTKLQPNMLMQRYIDKTLVELNLQKKGYGVIHIRTGDKYMVNDEKMNINFINYIKTIITSFVIPGRKYLIISDSNQLKLHLKTYPNFYILIKNIEHLGGEAMKSHDTDGVMNTMLDYYLMSYSNAIISLSIYEHVSGFSKYCAILNNIPFTFKKMEDNVNR
jgi:hypothetical protein